jgi:hypothetical protein
MYLNIPLIANVLTLADLRQKQIDKRLMRANAKRKTHDYQVSVIKFSSSMRLVPVQNSNQHTKDHI